MGRELSPVLFGAAATRTPIMYDRAAIVNPLYSRAVDDFRDMFPTPVGMNRCHNGLATGGGDVPHTRGDEPSLAAIAETVSECSPHPWG